MRIARLGVRNYRTLEALDLDFPSFYSAIGGRNDSGKTNVVNVARTLLKKNDIGTTGFPTLRNQNSP